MKRQKKYLVDNYINVIRFAIPDEFDRWKSRYPRKAFDSWEEAHSHLINRGKQSVKKAKLKLLKAEQSVKRALKMKRP